MNLSKGLRSVSDGRLGQIVMSPLGPMGWKLGEHERRELQVLTQRRKRFLTWVLGASQCMGTLLFRTGVSERHVSADMT